MTGRFPVVAGLVAFSLASLSCFGGDRADRYASMPSDTIPLVLGEGDLLITNTDTTMQLGLVGDTVLLQFSERMRLKLRADLDTTNLESGNGFGAAIERAVKRQVGSLLGRRLVRPLSQIESVSLGGHRIVFTYHDRHGFSFESMMQDNRPVLESFRPEDARAFVAAVRARKAQPR